MRYKGYLFLLVLSLLVGCGEDSKPTPKQDNEGWYKEEVITQLNEIKLELKALRKEIETLKSTAPGKNAGKKVTSIDLTADMPVLGQGAKIAVVEFSDFQCPFCVRHHKNVFSQLREKYIETGRISYFARDYPLNFHKQAKFAAVAAHCAGDQNAYWKMRDLLFSNKKYDKDAYMTHANTLGLEMDDFEKCIDTIKYQERVEQDIAYGTKIGVNGTPRFFVGAVKNNRLTNVISISGARPLEAFEAAIEKLSQHQK